MRRDSRRRKRERRRREETKKKQKRGRQKKSAKRCFFREIERDRTPEAHYYCMDEEEAKRLAKVLTTICISYTSDRMLL